MNKKLSLRCALGIHLYGRYLDISTLTSHWNNYVMICKRCGKESA